MSQLGEGLVARGHRVSVITAFPHYEKFRVWDEYRRKIVQRSTYRGMQVQRVWVYASGTKERMFNRLLSYLSFNALAAIAGIASRAEYDVILCSNGSFFSGLAAALIGAVKRAPFVYNVQDLYPETPVHAGQLRNKVAIAVLEWLERRMYQAAEHVSVITPSFRTNVTGKGLAPEKVSVIPNFVDSTFIRPLPRENEFSERHGLSGKFVVSHAGNLGYVYDLEALLEAAALLKDEQDIVFLIVGDGVMRQRLIDLVGELRLDSVRFLPFQAREELPRLRAASDVQLALYKHGSARYSMPSKVYEIMASGRPVLASAEPGSDLRRLVVDTQCGVCVEPHDARQLAKAILALRANPRLRRRMGERGRRVVEVDFSPESVVNRYDNLLRSIGQERKRAWQSLRLPRLG